MRRSRTACGPSSSISERVAARIHSVLPRVALWTGLVIPFAIFALYRSVTHVYEVPRGGDIFAFLRGTWAWTPADSGCRANPHQIDFSANHQTMTITAARPYRLASGALDSIAYYEILQVTRSSLRGVLRGETRLTRDSTPVEWDLVLTSPNSYTWHRTDWLSWWHTRTVQRCPAHPANRP